MAVAIHLFTSACIEWDSSSITTLAFHYLAPPCLYNNTPLDNAIEAPATFFIESLRFTLAIIFVIITISLYNSIKVLGRIVFSVASCSIHWIIYFTLTFIRSILFVIFMLIISSELKDDFKYINTTDISANDTAIDCTNLYTSNIVGFVITTLLQISTTFVLFCAIEHEFRYRSVDFASVDSPLNKRCASLSKLKYYITWPRCIYSILVGITLMIWIVIEILLACECPQNVNVTIIIIMIWVWLAFLFILRVGVVLYGTCLLFVKYETLKLTIPAKIYLVLGLLLSVGDEIPNSVINIYGHEVNCVTDYEFRYCIEKCHESDLLISPYDVIQCLGAFSLVGFFLFVRSQYLRVEQETKLLVVWDMQKLLQVNGRKDYRSYNTVS